MKDEKLIRTTGKFEFVVGCIQLVLLPLVVYAPKLFDPAISQDQFVTQAAINVVFLVALAAVCLVQGRKLRNLPIGELSQIQRAITVSTVTVVVALTFTLLNGGRAGILFMVLVIFLVRARLAVDRLKAAPKPTDAYSAGGWPGGSAQ